MYVKLQGDPRLVDSLRLILERGKVPTAESLPAEHGLPHLGYTIYLEWGEGPSVVFDSVDSELETNILSHTSELLRCPIVVDRPGGQVHSEHELRVVIPQGHTNSHTMAHAVMLGILRGLLDIYQPAPADKPLEDATVKDVADAVWKAQNKLGQIEAQAERIHAGYQDVAKQTDVRTAERLAGAVKDLSGQHEANLERALAQMAGILEAALRNFRISLEPRLRNLERPWWRKLFGLEAK